MLKKIFLFVVISSMLFSCESKGPKSRYYEEPLKTNDEYFQEVVDAVEGDGWLRLYDTDVFYLDGGEWNCYGRVSVYQNMEGDSGRKWVEFDGMKFAAEDTDKGGYFYRVKYGGTWFYF